jgi:chromate transport protein ChrA
MTYLQHQDDPHKSFVTIVLITLHLSAVAVTLAFIYLAWDGGRVIQQVVESKHVAIYSIEVYEAIYEHFFRNVNEPGWSPLAVFIGISNVIYLCIVAPAVLIITTGLLACRLRSHWRWLVIGSSVVVNSLFLWFVPSLRALSVILD